MPSPFPGMDPFIETKAWTDFHTTFNTVVREFLRPHLPKPYIATVESRVIVEMPDRRLPDRYPDVAVVEDPTSASGGTAVLEATQTVSDPLLVVLPTRTEFREHFVEIHDEDGGEVVTVIETLSPRNKCRGEAGRGEYEAKRETVLVSDAALVEIDLLRCGRPFPVGADEDQLGEYRVLISKPWQRPRAELYPIKLLQRLPIIGVPLREEDAAVPLDVQAAVDTVYERAGYSRFDYGSEITPPLPDQAVELLSR